MCIKIERKSRKRAKALDQGGAQQNRKKNEETDPQDNVQQNRQGNKGTYHDLRSG